ncbi:MAG: bifunctional riboflavin kinase/FAD synthetase [Myxococcota bacterium]
MPAVVAPGNYDGVHLGHRALVGRARARASGTPVVAMFFDPHPSVILAPDKTAGRLTSATRRRELLLRVGADEVVVQPFDHAFAELSPEAFVEEVLIRQLDAKAVVVGPDFRFGHRAAGDVDALRRLGARHSFEVETVGPVAFGGERVSSTRIRAALNDGKVTHAAELLDRYHEVDAEVIHGDQRGRTIGFPTANLRAPDVVVPSDGVYAVIARVTSRDGPVLEGVANLGVRPTLSAGRSVEVHLFDFDEDIYRETLRVGFVSRLRGEKKFDGLEALKAQIAMDATAARETLAKRNGEWTAWF